MTDNKLNFLSKFYNNNCFFGCYPNKTQFESLLNEGFNVFVDLTTLKEKNMLHYVYEYDIIEKNSNIHYINYSIVDNRPPSSKNHYLEFLNKIQNLIKNNENKIYIHCRGGHGRSSIIVSSLLAFLQNIPASKSFLITKQLHNNRLNLKDKYKSIDCPKF